MSPRTPCFDIIATMPAIFDGFRNSSLLGKAIEKKLLDLRIHPLRDYAHDKHRMIDDRPFGGGAGMVLKPEPLFAAIETLRAPAASRSATSRSAASRLLLLTPQGERFTQQAAQSLADWILAAPEPSPQILMICGRYEGVDERVIEHFQPEPVSIGDYVIAGGEVAAMVVLEAVARLLPGVLGNEESAREESFSEALIEYPHYTRPALFRELAVPEILLSGDHAAVEAWRRKRMIERTRATRPDLLGESKRQKAKGENIR